MARHGKRTARTLNEKAERSTQHRRAWDGKRTQMRWKIMFSCLLLLFCHLHTLAYFNFHLSFKHTNTHVLQQQQHRVFAVLLDSLAMYSFVLIFSFSLSPTRFAQFLRLFLIRCGCVSKRIHICTFFCGCCHRHRRRRRRRLSPALSLSLSVCPPLLSSLLFSHTHTHTPLHSDTTVFQMKFHIFTHAHIVRDNIGFMRCELLHIFYTSQAAVV